MEITCPRTRSNNAPWDQHGELKLRHEENARITDQPVAALLTDLKARGLLDETLVLWAGEMGMSAVENINAESVYCLRMARLGTACLRYRSAYSDRGLPDGESEVTTVRGNLLPPIHDRTDKVNTL